MNIVILPSLRSIIANLWLVILLSSIAVLSACSSHSPKAVAENFLEAVGNGDFEAAKTYGTEDTQKLMDMMNGIQAMTPDSVPLKRSFVVLSVKVDKDKATVMYQEKGRNDQLILPMIKVDKEWKVAASKETMVSAEGGNIMDTGATETDSSLDSTNDTLNK
jgi:hypothetical protein